MDREFETGEEHEENEEFLTGHASVALRAFQSTMFFVFSIAFLGVICFWVDKAYEQNIYTATLTLPNDCSQVINNTQYYRYDCFYRKELKVNLIKR